MEKSQIIDEAIYRAKLLKLSPAALRMLENGTPCKSIEPGRLEYLSDRELSDVREFEREYNCSVYHVIQGKYIVRNKPFEMYTYLYVSNVKEEWDEARKALMDARPMAYVKNVTDSSLSEVGSVKIKLQFWGVTRVG